MTTITLPLGAQTTPRGSSSDAGHRVCVEPRGGLVAEWCTWFAAGLLVIAVFVTPGCAPEPVAPERPECRDEALFAIWAQCVAREIEAGCDTDPVKLCPKLVDECLDRIEQWERCGS